MALDMEHSLVRELVDQLVEARFGDIVSGLKADLEETRRQRAAAACGPRPPEEHRDRLQRVLLAVNDGGPVDRAEVVELAARRGTRLAVVPTTGGAASNFLIAETAPARCR